MGFVGQSVKPLRVYLHILSKMKEKCCVEFREKLRPALVGSESCLMDDCATTTTSEVVWETANMVLVFWDFATLGTQYIGIEGTQT